MMLRYEKQTSRSQSLYLYFIKIVPRKRDGKIGQPAHKALKNCMENINIQCETIFTSFGQKTAEFYYDHILLTMMCIFCLEFGLKPRYSVLHLTENGKGLKTLFPLRYEIILTVPIAC